jgi:hypothetical protein
MLCIYAALVYLNSNEKQHRNIHDLRDQFVNDSSDDVKSCSLLFFQGNWFRVYHRSVLAHDRIWIVATLCRSFLGVEICE